MARALGRVAVVFVFVLCFLAAPAAANHVQCGDVVTTNTTLDSDLTCTGDGLVVEASKVTVDLAGHTIQGSGTASRGVIASAGDHVEIRNGRIRGFGEGVDADGARGTALQDMFLAHNGTGLHCAYAPECRIEDSVVRYNDAGIEIDAADGGSPEPTIVRRNVIRDNGLGVTVTGQRAIVSDNRITRNRTDGIRNDYGFPVDILRNVVRDNGGDGVRIFYIAHATVVDNRIVGNAGNGVSVYGSGGEFGVTTATVDSNRIARNGRGRPAGRRSGASTAFGAAQPRKSQHRPRHRGRARHHGRRQQPRAAQRQPRAVRRGQL